jgi:hypothetical protein
MEGNSHGTRGNSGMRETIYFDDEDVEEEEISRDLMTNWNQSSGVEVIGWADTVPTCREGS